MGRLRRADGHALGVLAVLALHRQEVHLDVGALPAFGLRVGANAQDFVPEVAHRNAVGGLAGDAAAQASNATVEVSNYGVAHQ